MTTAPFAPVGFALGLVGGARLTLRARHTQALWALCLTLWQGLALVAADRIVALAPLADRPLMGPSLHVLNYGALALAVGLAARGEGRVRPLLLLTVALLAASLPVGLCPLVRFLAPHIAARWFAVDGSWWMQEAERWLSRVPLLWLASMFGSSLALCAPGALNPARDSFERRLALRFLLGRTDEAVARVARVATLGVALGVWLVLSAIGVLTGFERDLFDKMVGLHAHLSLERVDAQAIEDGAPIERALSAAAPYRAAITGHASFVAGPIAVVSDINHATGELLGIDAAAAAKVLPKVAAESGRGNGRAGATEPARNTGRMQVALGAELARNLAVLPGDQVRLLVPTAETLTPVGPVPRMLTAEVERLITTNMYEADARLVVVTLPAARELLQLPERAISGVYVRLHRAETAAAVAEKILAATAPVSGPALRTIGFAERNQTLFAALALERVVASVVLAFIILVASFSVVNTLTMAIWQRRREIAILRAMGATGASMLSTFVWQGILVGGLGTLLGVVLGGSTLALLSRHGFGIPYEIYYLDTLPVHLSALDLLAVTLGSLLILWTFAVLPSQLAARLSPVEALRDG